MLNYGQITKVPTSIEVGFLYKEKTSQKPKGQRCIIVFKATICYSVFAYHLYMCYEKYY